MKSDSDDSASAVSSKPRNRHISSRFMPSSPRNSPTIADHIPNNNHSLKEQHDLQKTTKSSVFTLLKQRSYREFNSSETTDRNNNNVSKENNGPFIGRSMSMRYTGKSSSSLAKKATSDDSDILLGRSSFDENAMYKKSFNLRRNSDNFLNSVESGSDCFGSPKLCREVSSKYMSDAVTRGGRRTPYSDISSPLSSVDSLPTKKFNIQKVMKRANSLIGYKSSRSQWALSPGRSSSPSMSVESKGKPLSFSSFRPTNKSVEKILNMGFDLFRTNKTYSSSSPLLNSDDVHELRLLHNQLIQWRFANAKTEAVNQRIAPRAQSKLICALDGLTKLRRLVLQNKIQLQKEKLEMKLNFVLHSQLKLLDTWGGMERQHLAAITVMKECLHSLVSKVPLLEGAKVDIQSASNAQRHASDLTASIKTVLTTFSLSAEKTAELLSELAQVVAQEKLLLEELYNLFRTMCVLELKERSLKCSLIQLK